MRLRSLKQLIDIVKAMAQPKQITVLGSSSLLAGSPELGEKGRPLELSLDADMLVEPCDSGQAGVLHEAIGEGSLFHREYGVYADFMKPDILETLPKGWEKRCIFLGRDRSVRCLNPIDLAIVKLKLGRDKDVDLLKALIKAGIITISALRKAYQAADMSEREMFKAGRLLRKLETESEACYRAVPDTPPAVGESRSKYGHAKPDSAARKMPHAKPRRTRI
jgi:hypothetical protein